MYLMKQGVEEGADTVSPKKLVSNLEFEAPLKPQPYK